MQNDWTNPFAAKRDENYWQCRLGDISDDESLRCPDQVVYHDDHLENLLGLYIRSGKDKQRGLSNTELLETDMESNQHNLLQARPSDRETAVWDALEASESSFPKKLQGREIAHGLRWVYGSQSCTGKERMFEEFLEAGGIDPLPDEHIPVVDFKFGTGGSKEGWNEVMEDKVEPKDGWHYVAQDDTFTDGDHVASMPLRKLKARQAKSEANKKKLNFNFGSRGNAPLFVNAQWGDGQKLSLAQQLQNLAEAQRPFQNQHDESKQATPAANLPMSERLLELVQSDSKMTFGKKVNLCLFSSNILLFAISGCLFVCQGRKPSLGQAKINVFQHGGNKDKLTEGDSINHVVERENDITSSLSSACEVSKGKSINDQLQRALLAAAPPLSMNDLNRPGKIHGPVFGFTARLQKVLDREKIDRANFLKILQSNEYKGDMSFMDVQIVSKSLEARLVACVCNIQKLPEGQGINLAKVRIIFNVQTNAHLELEPGTVVRVYPPWQEIEDSEFGKTVLCTYFCEVIKRS